MNSARTSGRGLKSFRSKERTVRAREGSQRTVSRREEQRKEKRRRGRITHLMCHKMINQQKKIKT